MTVAHMMSLDDNYIKRLCMTKRNRMCKDLVIIVKLLSNLFVILVSEVWAKCHCYASTLK